MLASLATARPMYKCCMPSKSAHRDFGKGGAFGAWPASEHPVRRNLTGLSGNVRDGTPASSSQKPLGDRVPFRVREI